MLENAGVNGGHSKSGVVEDAGDLEAFARLMKLSSEISDAAIALSDTEYAALGMKLMEAADRLADEAGTLATRSGYTVDQVTQPLWAPREGMPRARITTKGPEAEL